MTDAIPSILEGFKEKGVRLWSKDGKLFYEAPKGVMTPGDFERLRLYRSEITNFIQRLTGSQIEEPVLEVRARNDRAPLSFSQWAYWNTYLRAGQRSIRGVCSATRLRGRLNADILEHSIAAIVQRHEALRTRIIICDGLPTQQIDEFQGFVLTTRDLTMLQDSCLEDEVKRAINEHVLEKIDVGVDSLFGAWLLKLRETEHVLIVAMEHIISDGFSRNILVRDIFETYSRELEGDTPCLPEMPLQFADYAIWQQNTHGLWIEKHGQYWKDRLAGCGRLSFQDVWKESTAGRAGFGIVPVTIDAAFAADLREWCRARRTTLPMAVFTAYVGAVLRWCDTPASVFLYQTDGRFSRNVQNTIGYFAFPLFLHVELRENDSFLDLMERITTEYCNAHEHADFSYLESQIPKPEFAQNTRFNWVSQGPSTNHVELSVSDGSLVGSLIPFEQRVVEDWEMDGEPELAILETNHGIDAALEFPLDRISFEQMEAFSQHIRVFLTELLKRPERCVNKIPVRPRI